LPTPRSHRDRPAQHRPAQHRSAQHRPAQHRSTQHRPAQHCDGLAPPQPPRSLPHSVRSFSRPSRGWARPGGRARTRL